MTRVDDEKVVEALVAMVPGFVHAKIARTLRLEVAPIERALKGPVAVVTAGTSDMPVAEEAVETLSAVGLEPLRFYDIGVAGLHRLLHRVEDLRRAGGGHRRRRDGGRPAERRRRRACSTPIVLRSRRRSAYRNTALGGFTPLFAMLTSCASGVVVVNIDSGFGAAMAVHRILHRANVDG